MTRFQKLQLRLFRLILSIQHLVFSLLSGLLFGFARPAAEPTAILALRTGGLGDFLFAIPALAALRKRFPKARIVLMTISSANTTNRGDIDKYSGKNAYPWLSFAHGAINDAIILKSLDPRYLVREVRPEVRKLNPSMTFMLVHPGECGTSVFKKLALFGILGVRGAVYGWRTKANYGLMKGVQFKAGLLEHKIMGPVHALMECPLIPGIEESEVDCSIHLGSESSQWADQVWVQRSLQSKLVIGFAPGSVQSFKAWPAAKYIQLGRRLLENPAAVILVIGTNLDLKVTAEISAALGDRAINVAGQSSVHQSAALMKKCRLLVANDGGAVHLANSVGCLCVTISSGNEYPGSIEPWFSQAYSVRHDVPCAPCYAQTYCPKGHALCVQDIPVEHVFGKCVEICGDVF